ncbi:MAG: NAD+ synthase [Candidatus Cloacimonetes bacterium]|nr:NAD+ synthase [Candidatus Cloacimonadota bacterium]
MRFLNIYEEIRIIKNFIVDTVKNAGFEKVILGLSGGLDSAVVAALCKIALGENSVLGVMMPYKNSHPDSLKHAKQVSELLGISYEIITISDIVDSYFFNNKTQISDDSPPESKTEIEVGLLRLGNFMARTRMSILYDLSSKNKALVVGTSNKSEIFTGYCTQYGDSACAFEPIAHLYKTEVKALAEKLDIPLEIINKEPTADLWEGQTDEQELGISYPILDTILYSILDEKKDKKTILNSGISEYKYDLVMQKIKGSSFKRKLPNSMDKVYEL